MRDVGSLRAATGRFQAFREVSRLARAFIIGPAPRAVLRESQKRVLASLTHRPPVLKTLPLPEVLGGRLVCGDGIPYIYIQLASSSGMDLGGLTRAAGSMEEASDDSHATKRPRLSACR